MMRMHNRKLSPGLVNQVYPPPGKYQGVNRAKTLGKWKAQFILGSMVAFLLHSHVSGGSNQIIGDRKRGFL